MNYGTYVFYTLLYDSCTKFDRLIKYFMKNILRFGATQTSHWVAAILDFKMAASKNFKYFWFYICWRRNFSVLNYKPEAKELNSSTIKFPWRLDLRFQDGVF